VAPVIVRARSAYQTALESGRSAEEIATEHVAGQEIGALCSYIDRFLFGEKKPPIAP
jgi:chromosome partitioning protein